MGGVPPWGGGRVVHGPLRTFPSARPASRSLARVLLISILTLTVPRIGSAPRMPQDQCRRNSLM